MRFIRSLIKTNFQDPLKEKTKDYKRIVLLQIAIIVSGLLFSGMLAQDTFTSRLTESLFSFLGALYAFLLWDLLKNFTNARWLIITFLIMLIILVLSGFAVEFPFYQLIEVSDKRTFFLIFHGLLFPIEVVIIGFAIIDIFSGNVMSEDKLWGAASVYLMIGISFGSLYDFINVGWPGIMGEYIPVGWVSYSESIYYSFNVLGGLDTAYPDVKTFVRNLSVIEAVWGQLYIVLIIGKLLTLPRKNLVDGR